MQARRATPEDAEQVYAIKFAAYAEQAIRARGRWDEAMQRAYTQRNLPHTWLLQVGGAAVGWIAWRESEAAFELIDVHILPSHQRRGLGTAVLKELIGRAEAARKPVTLGVLRINPSRALYERLGFRATGDVDIYTNMRRDPSPAR